MNQMWNADEDIRSLRKIIKERHYIVIEILHHTVESHGRVEFLQFFEHGSNHFVKPCILFRTEALLQLLRLRLMFLLELPDSGVDAQIIQNHLGRWIDYKLLHTFDGSLALDIKTADAVNVIAPQLNTIRALFG